MAILPGQLSPAMTRAAVAAFGLAIAGYAGVNHVKPQQFGLRETFYSVVSDVLPPKVYLQVPIVQYTHTYEANTQRISFGAGSCRFIPTCDSTADQNPLVSDIVINYRVLPDKQKLSFHRWAMEGFVMQDGYWLLTDMMNVSANAVLGRKTMAQTISHPDEYLKDFYEDLSSRLAQNNVPVEIESLELKGFHTSYIPTRDVSYSSIGKTVEPLAPTAKP